MCPSRALGHVQALGRPRRTRPSWVRSAVALADMRSTFATGDFWFSADSWTQGAAGYASEFIDLRDATHKLIQPTAANRASMITGSINRNAAVFAGNQWYDSNRSAAFWSCMHLFGTMIAVWAPTLADGATEMVASTYIGPGFLSAGELLRLGPNPDARVYEGTTTVILATSPTALTNGQWTYHGYRISSTQYTAFERGMVIAQGTPSPAPGGSGNAPLRLGMRPNASLGARMHWRSLYGWQRLLSNADLTKVRTYIEVETGIAA